MILTSTEQKSLGCCFPIKNQKNMMLPTVPLVGQKTRPLHEKLAQLVITENTF